jgi:hypothetical protein
VPHTFPLVVISRADLPLAVISRADLPLAVVSATTFVDHLFRLGVNSMYHEAVYLGVQPFLKTYGSTRQFFPPARLFVIGMFAPLRGIIM